MTLFSPEEPQFFLLKVLVEVVFDSLLSQKGKLEFREVKQLAQGHKAQV